jgi:hypothetical protein
VCRCCCGGYSHRCQHVSGDAMHACTSAQALPLAASSCYQHCVALRCQLQGDPFIASPHPLCAMTKMHSMVRLDPTLFCVCDAAMAVNSCRGNLILQNVVLSSSSFNLTACPFNTTLAIGGAVSCTGSYTVTQADVEAGVVTIRATGSSPSLPAAAQVVWAPDWVVPVDSKPQLVLDILAPNCSQHPSPGKRSVCLLAPFVPT